MNINQIRSAWDGQQSPPCHWLELADDEKLDFALRHIEAETRAALHDLSIAVYEPDKSAISVAHALGHINQIFSA